MALLRQGLAVVRDGAGVGDEARYGRAGCSCLRRWRQRGHDAAGRHLDADLPDRGDGAMQLISGLP